MKVKSDGKGRGMDQIDITFKAGVEYQGKIYASAKDLNGLFQVDLRTEDVKYIKRFSKECDGGSIHQMAFLHNNEAWFIPRMGKYIAIVNLDTMDIEYLTPLYRKIINKVDNAMYYSGMIIENNFLCLIPMKVDTLLLIDMDTKRIYPYEGILEEGECYPYGAYAKGYIFLYPYVGKEFIEFNLRTKEQKRYSWDYPFEAYEEVLYCKNKIWFTPLLSDRILTMDINTKTFIEISLGNLYDKDCKYHQIVVNGNALFFIPFESDKVLRLDLLNEKISKICLPIKDKCLLVKFSSLKLMVLASHRDNFLYIYDDKLKKIKMLEIKMSRGELINKIELNQNGLKSDVFTKEGFFIRSGIYREKYLGLKKYMFYGNATRIDDNNSSGKSIWRELRNIWR